MSAGEMYAAKLSLDLGELCALLELVEVVSSSRRTRKWAARHPARVALLTQAVVKIGAAVDAAVEESRRGS